MIRSLYEVLQVRPDADPEVIAAAFRALSKRYHPDVNKAADSSRVMKEINHAYKILNDPVERAEHDRLLSAQQVRTQNSDGRFIAYDNGTVLDTKTNLLWATKDNDSDIDWNGAKTYCENYRGGGYIDWRMPTQDELAGLYDRGKSYKAIRWDCDVHLTELIQLSVSFVWGSEMCGSDAANFDFNTGILYRRPQSWGFVTRALPVRSGK